MRHVDEDSGMLTWPNLVGYFSLQIQWGFVAAGYQIPCFSVGFLSTKLEVYVSRLFETDIAAF